MNQSVLLTIKKLLGITEDYTVFDTDIIIHINTALSILRQLGVTGDVNIVTSSNITWAQIVDDDEEELELVKTYMYQKVRSNFDPPASSTIADAMNKTIAELEWRINVASDK